MARPNLDPDDQTVRISMRLPGKLAGRLLDEANETGVTLSEQLRRILEWYFDDSTIFYEEANHGD